MSVCNPTGAKSSYQDLAIPIVRISAGWPKTRTLNRDLLMAHTVQIRKSGNLIELSNSGSELPEEIRNIIEPHLTYTYQKLLRGPDRRDPITGYDRGPIKFEECRLYRYDGKGRLCCGKGFLPKITSLLKQAGANVICHNCDPIHPRPTRFLEAWDNVAANFKFRAKQDDCLVSIAANECGVIKAPTGFGKGTIIAMVSLLYPNAKTHIIVPSKDLVEKTVNYLTRYVPSVGQVGCGKKRISRVTVFSADSLHLSDGDADIVLADEIHKLAAPTISQELAKYKYSRNYGFSATPEGRLDGADAKLESLFGPQIFTLSYQEAADLKLVVPIMVQWLDVRMDINPADGKKDVAKKRWGIWRNEYRNQVIANKALSFASDDQVLILVETIEHLMFLRKHLPFFSACYSENGLQSSDLTLYRKWGLMGESELPVSAKQREQMRRDFEQNKLQKVIATSVWATGVDFESLSVLIRADALGSEIMDTQAPGRVSRISTDKEYGIVVDCMDQFDEGFRRKALSRGRNYKANGWSQIMPPKGVRHVSQSI